MYISLDGLTYSIYKLHSIFPSPKGARKNASNEQNVHAYYMLNHQIRDLLFHLEKSRQNLVFPVLRPENLWNLDFAVQYIILLCNTVAYFARSLDLIW